MAKRYMEDKGMKFADKHEYVLEKNGDDITINRINTV